MAEGYDYDFFVIGGGSGGLAAAKAASGLGAKVAVADFVKPSPAGTTWGLGGTCVNVGCIPKKLMHISSLYREVQADANGLGWDTKSSHSWEAMVSNVNNYIKGLNFGAKTDLRGKAVKYYNSFATFADPHTVELDNGKGKIEKVTFKYCLIACGGRPNYGDYPGAEECCVSSDDIFWQKKAPGKTLVIGASYIALECAGFLAGFGFDVTVMVRSILLRGFDPQIADMIGAYMEGHHCKFAREMVPSKFEKTASGQIKVFVKDQEYGIFDTVLVAIGRTGCAGWLKPENAGLVANKNGKFVCNEEDQSTVPHIYCAGDVIEGRPELTPVAIQAGRLLVRRLFGGSTKLMDYTDVATAVFTPLEYGAVGYGEDDARKALGNDRVKVYHCSAVPLEWNTAGEDRKNDQGYMKVIVDTQQDEKVIGFHVLGPQAGEVIQGISVAVKAGCTKQHLDDCVGIHPTFAEAYTTMTEVKEEGQAPPAKAGC